MRKIITAKLRFLSADEGGRPAPPIFTSRTGYRPHLVITIAQKQGAEESQEALLGVMFLTVPEHVKAGEVVSATLGLLYWPEVDYSGLVPGTTFDILEGSKVVGHGKVNGN
jgi:hypothetical protein